MKYPISKLNFHRKKHRRKVGMAHSIHLETPGGGHSIVKRTEGGGSIVWGLGFCLGKDNWEFFKNIDLDNS